MSTSTRSYDSTVARIAGNILSGVYDAAWLDRVGFNGLGEATTCQVKGAVALARAIVAETKRTEPAKAEGTTSHD